MKFTTLLVIYLNIIAILLVFAGCSTTESPKPSLGFAPVTNATPAHISRIATAPLPTLEKSFQLSTMANNAAWPWRTNVWLFQAYSEAQGFLSSSNSSLLYSNVFGGPNRTKAAPSERLAWDKMLGAEGYWIYWGKFGDSNLSLLFTTNTQALCAPLIPQPQYSFITVSNTSGTLSWTTNLSRPIKWTTTKTNRLFYTNDPQRWFKGLGTKAWKTAVY